MTKYRIVVLLFLGITIWSGCKRGANDPFFSFNSRDARVINTWELATYQYKEKNSSGVNIHFNNIKCDELNETGETLLSTDVENEFATDNLIAKITEAEGSIGNSRNFDIDFNFELEIKQDNHYTVSGYYNYYDDVSNHQIDGEIIVTESEWFWMDSQKDKISLMLLNFPEINTANILENGVPISYVNNKIIEIDELRKDKMVWTENSDFSYDGNVSSDSFIVNDTIEGCKKITYFFERQQIEGMWEFVPKGE
ncbi:MAG: hypothetical protein R2798_02740 [Chitinophagales bacterium]|nr:hypothetical protein [Bacteroidota bacterium]MCB9042246.1 hypothetical protein [Chitinophagales bacterium]